MDKTNEIERLIYIFSKLPGLGQRSARRIVLHLLQDKEIRLKNLIDGLALVNSRVVKCRICGNIDSYSICGICSSTTRDASLLAIVETVAELWAIERSGMFKGRYHVLGSALSASAYATTEHLRLTQLLNRCESEQIQEIIIATNATLEGQTTAYFITEYFKPHNIKISKLASGVPIGGELEYLDEGTLSAAISLRQPFE